MHLMHGWLLLDYKSGEVRRVRVVGTLDNREPHRSRPTESERTLWNPGIGSVRFALPRTRQRLEVSICCQQDALRVLHGPCNL